MTKLCGIVEIIYVLLSIIKTSKVKYSYLSKSKSMTLFENLYCLNFNDLEVFFACKDIIRNYNYYYYFRIESK